MQEFTENAVYFKKIYDEIKTLELALDMQPTPFCVLELVYRKNIAHDIRLVFSNKAFKASVNNTVAHSQLISEVSRETVEYWIGPLEAVAKTKSAIVCNNYTVYDGHATFNEVTIFPISAMNGNMFGMVLAEQTYTPNSLCLKCPNNPTVVNPSLKMVPVTVEDSGYSVCEICRTVRSLSFPNGV